MRRALRRVDVRKPGFGDMGKVHEKGLGPLAEDRGAQTRPVFSRLNRNAARQFADSLLIGEILRLLCQDAGANVEIALAAKGLLTVGGFSILVRLRNGSAAEPC